MSFLNELKVAVINRDLKKIEELVDKKPDFSSIDEAKEIVVFYNEAIKILRDEKEKLSKEMKKIKNLQKFYQDSEKPDKERFNFKV